MLALGIAGATVMFALVQGIVLRKLPVREQDRLLVAWKRFPTGSFEHYPFRGAEIDTIGAESRMLERVAGIAYTGASVDIAVEDGSASEINTAPVTGAFFDVLGVEAILGRALRPDDDVLGAENVLVITSRSWRRRYGGAPDVIGRRLTIGERPFTIVGVMPPDVAYPPGVEGWMTVTACATTLTNPTFREAVRNQLDLLARLRPGVTPEQAEHELRGLIARLESGAPPDAHRGLLPVVRSYESLVVGHVRPAIFVLFGAVGLVLLIACANVANLLLLRVATRRGELAVRAALGAGRARLARQLLAESVLLASVGGALGLALTHWLLRAVLSLVPGGLPRSESVRVDPAVLLFTLAVVLLVTALAGVGPASSSARTDLVSQFSGGRRGMDESAVRPARRLLVVAQVALAVTVVAASGLLTRSLLRLQNVEAGLSTDRLVFVPHRLPDARYAGQSRHLQLLEDVVRHLEAAPGIDAATPVNAPPFGGVGWDAPTFVAEGQDADQAARNPSLNLEAIHPNHFRALGVALVSGRGFTEADRPGATDVAIVSEDVASRVWPGEGPIGKRLRFAGSHEWRTVVGVARPSRYRDLAEPRPTVYVPAPQFMVSARNLVLRTSSPQSLVAGLVRDRVRAVDPDVQVMRLVPFAELREGPLARPRFNALLIGLFGLTALLLTSIGLHAVMGVHVRQRQGEMGIRMALGATAANVRGLVLRQALRLAGAGAAIGLASAVAAGRAVRGLLYHVDPLDPASILGAALILLLASGLAAYLPARRAARVDPAVALRTL
jgi:predicted permease